MQLLVVCVVGLAASQPGWSSHKLQPGHMLQPGHIRVGRLKEGAQAGIIINIYDTSVPASVYLFPNPRQRFALRIWPGTIHV